MLILRKNTLLALSLLAPWPIGCTWPAPEEDGASGRELEPQAWATAATAVAAGGQARGDSSPSLVRKDSCEEVAAPLKARLVQAMEARLQANLDRALFAAGHGCDEWYDEAGSTSGAPDGGGAPGSESEKASEYSETNVQVAGVDEADFVKNDGGYLYVLADGRFRVLDAWPAAEARELSSFPLQGTPRRMYVHADTAVIYSSLEALNQSSPADPWSGGAAEGECTYGYDCEFTGDGRQLQISILDISDRAKPRLVRELMFEGSYLNSRRIGAAVHTAVVFPELEVPGLSYWPDGLPAVECGFEDRGVTTHEVKALFEALRLANLERIEQTPVTGLLPRVRDTWYADGAVQTTQGPLSACDELYVSPSGDGPAFLSLVSFAIGAQAPVAASTILSRPGAVYASKDSLYVAVRHKRGPGDSWFPTIEGDAAEATTVHKFALHPGGAAAEYAASGAVGGRILNQFAMDEHSGALRIATTSGYLPDPNVYSTVAVLMEQGSRLMEVGRVDHLAPGEDIRSVRYRGDVGFVVTFKKTDPLFVLDLADPGAPSVKGELKIPGFSTYMHLMDDDHLLTMGYDADDQGDFAWFQGIQLQVIDVSQLAHPVVLDKEVIGTRGSTSEAATDHLAFTFFKARDLLAVPMTICEAGVGGQYGDLMTFSGLLVYRVTVDGGFTRLGGVPHEEPETPQSWSGKCNNWWTDSNSTVQRSVFMEDWVFSIARDRVNVAHLDDLAHPARSIPLAGG